MNWLKQNFKALAESISVFVVLFLIIMLLTNFYDFSDVDLGPILFIFSTLVSVFIAKNTFYKVRYKKNASNEDNKSALGLAVSSEEVYLQLYENSPVPYMIIDLEGKVKSANMAAARMLSVSKTKINGINVFSKLKCEDAEHLDLLVVKFKRGVSVSGELVKIKRTDKRQAWGLLSLFPFNNSIGEDIGLLALVDITKQKKAEDAKSEFVSLASHQLRTPIAGMKWSTELLLMDSPENLTSRQRKYIDRLLISVKRMAVLVDDFLRVSRFELGTFQPDYKTVNLSSLFEDIMMEQSPRVAQKKLVVKTFYDESINSIVTDLNLIRMIVTNLYSNATKYTREAGTIHLGFASKNDNIVITVADNGMGIPLEDQDEIFSKLFRASNAVRDVPDGTGLGLYIVKEAVSVLQGNVSFTTTENIGTTFEVVLPLELSRDRVEEDEGKK